MKTGPPSLSDQMRSAIADLPASRLQFPLGIGIAEPIALHGKIRLQAQPRVAVHQHQPRQHTAQAEQEYQQPFLEFPKRPFFPKAEADQFLERLSSFRQHRFLGGWTGRRPDVRLTIHGAYSEPWSILRAASVRRTAVQQGYAPVLFMLHFPRKPIGEQAPADEI